MGTNFVRVFGLIERVSVGVGVGVSVGVGVQWCFVCHGLENSTWTLGHLGTLRQRNAFACCGDGVRVLPLS